MPCRPHAKRATRPLPSWAHKQPSIDEQVRNFLMVLSDDPEGNRAVLRALSDIASERKANLERIAQEQKALGRPSSRSPERRRF